MSGVVLVNPRSKWTDSSGTPIANGSVTVYLAGTTTVATTYQDVDLTAANEATITLDANGECLMWAPPGSRYKILLKDSHGATVPGYPVDNLNGAADIAAAAAAAAAAAQPYVDEAEEHANAAANSETNAATASAAAQSTVAAQRYATKALMDADLSPIAGVFAFVYADTTATLNGLYYKVGGTGTGSWSAYFGDRLTESDLKNKAAAGDSYALGAAVAVGSTTPNTTTYAGAFTDTFFPASATAARGYLQDFSVRTAAAGTGQVIVIAPDLHSQYGWRVLAVTAVTTASGVNTFVGSAIYSSVLPAGSRVGYRYLTGGHVRYQAGGPVKRIATNAQTAGNALSGTLLDYAQDVAVAFTTRPATVDSLAERVTDVEGGTDSRGLSLQAILGQEVATSSTAYGNAGLASSGSLVTGFWVYAIGPTTAHGTLDTITVPTTNPFSDPDGTVQTAQAAIVVPNASGTYDITDVWTLYLAPGKTNTISAMETFLPAGAYVAISGTNARAPVQYKAGTTDGGGLFVNAGGALVAGNTLTLSAYSNTPIFAYTVKQAASSLGQRVEDLEDAVADIAPLAPATTLVSQRFTGTSFPAGWTNAGTWTVNDGLVSPAAGGWGVYAVYSSDCSIDNRALTALGQINSASAVFGIASKPPEVTINGAAAIVDIPAGKLRLYSWDGTAVAGSYETEVALPAMTYPALFSLEVVKEGLTSTITFTNRTTQASCTLTETQKASQRQWHGKAGLVYVSGSGSANDIKVDSFDMVALHSSTPRAIVIGDSICEGTYLPLESPSWPYQLAARRTIDNDVIVAGRSGDESANTINRVALDVTPFSPKYVILAMGTNDTSQATWRTNMASLIASVVARGAEPILCTMIPYTPGQAVKTAMNADIRSGYFGRYRWIDMAYAVSSSNDGVTWNASYNSGDGVHPNYAGQIKMYQQALADAPFLIR